MFIQFGMGQTRMVVLIGAFAIKVPRIRLLRPFVRLFQTARAGTSRTRLDHYDKDLFRAALMYLFPGIITNYWERRLCVEYPHVEFLAQTHFSLFGLINIQQRGDSITDESDPRFRAFKAHLSQTTNFQSHDLLDAKNCCVIDGKICMLDYGDRRVREFLVTTIQHTQSLRTGSIA